MFREAGGTLIDTAAAYGAGDAERLIGRLIKDAGRARGDGDRDQGRVRDPGRRADRRHVAPGPAAGPGRLADAGWSTDYVDLWQIHAFGDAPLAESLAAVDYAVATGRVRYAGVSNFVGWQTAQAATWQSAFPGRTPISSAQVEYSLLARRAEVEVLPAVRAFGMGFFPWSPLGRGVLTGQYRTGTPRGSRAATDHFAWFVEPYLEPPQPRRRRGGGPGRRGSRPDPAPGRAALGPGRPGRDRSAARGADVPGSSRPPWPWRTSDCRPRSPPLWTTSPAAPTPPADRLVGQAVTRSPRHGDLSG